MREFSRAEVSECRRRLQAKYRASPREDVDDAVQDAMVQWHQYGKGEFQMEILLHWAAQKLVSSRRKLFGTTRKRKFVPLGEAGHVVAPPPEDHRFDETVAESVARVWQRIKERL